jgi:DNA-directed RNA polymerase subunit H (RpoH/RPB5)
MESKLIYLISKARQNVLELMDYNGYDTTEYNNFTKSEVNAMSFNQQLDMILTKSSDHSKIFIKFELGKKTAVLIDNLREEYFPPTEAPDEMAGETNEYPLGKKDILYIIFQSDPNQSVVNRLKHIWETEGIYIVPQSLMRLQFNILHHHLVPPHRIMAPKEVTELKSKKHLKLEELPRISRFDPVAQAICIKPGEVCEIMRASRNSIVSHYYRVCVNMDFAM